MADLVRGIAPQIDTHANWVSANPTLGKDVDSKSYGQVIFATGSPVGDIMVYGNDQTYNQAYAAGQYLIAGITLSATEINKSVVLGDVKISYNQSLGPDDGYLPFGYPAVSQSGDYADLYTAIGDIFENMWTGLGYSASGAGMFYGTPPPGAYPRAAIPKATISTDDVDTANDRIDDPDGNTFAFHILKDGTPVILTTDDTAPGGITAGTVYYARLVNSNGSIEFYDTAENAIDDSGTTGRVDITSTGTGPHYISNAGVRLDDAFQGHNHYLGRSDYSSSTRVFFQTGGGGLYLAPGSNVGQGGSWKAIRELTNDIDGTPRTTNETRPDTILVPHYIKAKAV